MEKYSRLSESEIVAVLAEYAIPDLLSFKLLSGGSENTNYFVKTKSGKYVLSICEQKTKEKAEELADLLKHLQANHFNTSKIIDSIQDKPVIIWQGKPVMVKKFIEGKIQKNLSPKLLQFIGKELAKLHQVDAPKYLSNQLNYGKEQFANVKKYAANSEFDHWLQERLASMQPYFNLDLPKSLIHCDVFWDNIIINEEETEAVIMDFEEAVHYYRILDIGMTIIGICAEGQTINLEKARYLLAGYQSEIQLLEDEVHSLKAFAIYAGTAMTFWRHQNFHYIKPDPKMRDHYLGLKVLVEYLEGQREDCFVTS